MKNTLKAIVAGLVLAGSSTAFAGNPPPAVKADAPNRYIVKKGDTLWSISGKYLNAPHRWREIWAANKQLKNPHLIYPNDVLLLCIIKGKTMVGVDTGEGCAGIERNMEATSAPKIQNSPYNSIDPIPFVNVRHWLERAVIVNPADFDATPYVLASKEGNLLTATGDTIYVKGATLNVGQTYGVYRKSEPYIDIKTNKVAGLEAIQVARGVVTNVASNGVSSLKITHVYDTVVREGDKVFNEIPTPMPEVFYPAPAEITRGGSIARVLGGAGIGSAGKDSVVAINIGAAQGAKLGHVLDVYRKGSLVLDHQNKDIPVRLPSEKSGQLMIFRVFDNISYAYVLSADAPLNQGDQLLSPPYL